VEILMTELISVLFSLFIVGLAHAAEIADAPLPEPNYVGIIIFLVLTFGGCGWYMWRVMTGGNKDNVQGK